MGNVFRGCRRHRANDRDGDWNRRKPNKRSIKKPSKQNLNSLNNQINVLDVLTGHDITQHYKIGEVLGHGEFGITYLCMERSMRLIMRVDREDVRREELFVELDVEKKGEISFDELQEALHKQGHDFPDSDARMIMEAVVNLSTSQDGKIIYGDFTNMMNSGTDWRIAPRQYSGEWLNNLSWRLQQEGIVSVG